MEIQERIGRRMKEAREFNGWTQDDVGVKLERYLGRRWTKQSVSAAEGGGRVFDAEELVVLALLFNRRVGWFFTVGDTVSELSDSEYNKVQLPNGMLLPEEMISQAVGRKRDDARRLSSQLRHIADEVAAIYPADEEGDA